MLSYDMDEAIELLTDKLATARKNLELVHADLGFLRDQITTMEVNTARVHNWDVKRRREQCVLPSYTDAKPARAPRSSIVYTLDDPVEVDFLLACGLASERRPLGRLSAHLRVASMHCDGPMWWCAMRRDRRVRARSGTAPRTRADEAAPQRERCPVRRIGHASRVVRRRLPRRRRARHLRSARRRRAPRHRYSRCPRSCPCSTWLACSMYICVRWSTHTRQAAISHGADRPRRCTARPPAQV